LDLARLFHDAVTRFSQLGFDRFVRFHKAIDDGKQRFHCRKRLNLRERIVHFADMDIVCTQISG